MIDEYFQNEKILKQVKRKELLSLQRKTFNLISKIKLKKLSVSIDADFKADEFCFRITVFDESCYNGTLSVYEFQDVEESWESIKKVLQAIKTDDFSVFEKVLKSI